MIATKLCGAVVHLLILLGPLLASRGLVSLADTSVITFAILITCFYICDLPPHMSQTDTRRDRSDLDMRSNRLAAVSCFVLVALFWLMLMDHVARRPEISPWARCAGSLGMLLGVVLRFRAIRTLREGFVTEATPAPHRLLVKSGIYAWMRHPSETGLLCIVFGAAALLGSYFGALAALSILVPLMAMRLFIEEKALLAAFGPPYKRYMRRVNRFIPGIVVLVFLARAVCADDEGMTVLFARHCLECHNASDHKGGLDLTQRDRALAGGDSGKVLMPGTPDESLLVKRVEEAEMPPEGRAKLDAGQRKLVREWVAAGAKWATDPIDPFLYSSERRAGYNWWSLQPLRAVEPPVVSDQKWPANPIDQFLLHRLESSKLTPAPRADRQTLVRRLSFDLLGLPPSPEEVAEFVQDERPQAYEQLVDRLLDSPHYGERWARHWLDIVRYGESQGFERNKLRANAWKYRDFVVEAFNSDLPYDEFIRWQIAGDVLHPDDPLAVVASGFLVMGPYDLTAYTTGTQDMRSAAREEELEGLVATVCQTFLGLTVNCGRCHDHKFDPITQREFYQISAALGGTFHGDERESVPESARSTVATRSAALKTEIDAITARENATDGRAKQDLVERRSRLESVTRLLGGGPVHSTVAQQPGPWRILARGDFRQPGDVVAPHGIASVGGISPDWKLGGDCPEAERRKALANWIADPNNPLTPRVIVNRLWGYHFGDGLVRTPSDFGFQGGLPSHPELLDWLAGQLVHPPAGKPWSLKRIQRLIVMSAAYQQSSATPKRSADMPNNPQSIDADNRLVWRRIPQRLDAETFRDAVLAVSGQLDLRLGGPGFRDFTVSSAGNNERYSVVDAVGPEFNRRSLYRTCLRGGTSPLLDTLDCPDPSVATPRRSVTSTPLQALTLLNNKFIEHYAEQFAERLRREAPEDATAQVCRAMNQAFSRQPAEEEISFGQQFVAKHGLTQFCIVLLNANEFMFVD